MRLLAGIVFVGLLLMACGGGSKKSATSTAAVSSPAPTQTQAPASTPASTASATAAVTPVPVCTPVQTSGIASIQVTATATTQAQGALQSVTAVAMPCFDRATFTFSGAGVPAYNVRYVPSTSQCASGMPVTTAGPAQLSVDFRPAAAHDDNGMVTVNTLGFAPNLASIKELKSTCDFEGVVAWVVGTELRFYTATVQQSPTRIVIDVYH